MRKVLMVAAALGLAACVASGPTPEMRRMSACARQGMAYAWQAQRCVPGPAGTLVDASPVTAPAPAAASAPDLSLPAWNGQVVDPGSPEAAALDGLVTGAKVALPWATAGSGK